LTTCGDIDGVVKSLSTNLGLEERKHVGKEVLVEARRAVVLVNAVGGESMQLSSLIQRPSTTAVMKVNPPSVRALEAEQSTVQCGETCAYLSPM
jgi:hypothetical protein